MICYKVYTFNSCGLHYPEYLLHFIQETMKILLYLHSSKSRRIQFHILAKPWGLDGQSTRCIPLSLSRNQLSNSRNRLSKFHISHLTLRRTSGNRRNSRTIRDSTLGSNITPDVERNTSTLSPDGTEEFFCIPDRRGMI